MNAAHLSGKREKRLAGPAGATPRGGVSRYLPLRGERREEAVWSGAAGDLLLGLCCCVHVHLQVPGAQLHAASQLHAAWVRLQSQAGRPSPPRT